MKRIEIHTFLNDFEIEAKAHVEIIENFFLDAGVLTGTPKQMDKLLRAAHSLKGTAGLFSLEKIVSVAHELESVFAQIKEKSLKLNSEIVDVILQSVDCLKDLISNTKQDDAINIEPIVNVLRKYANIQSELPADNLLPDEINSEDDSAQIYKKITKSKSSSSINLDISVIDNLIDLANENTLTKNQLLSVLSGYENTIPGLSPILYEINRLTNTIQEKIMLTRMRPISTIFSKFNRVIHDIAKELEKEISVKMIRDDLTLDKYLLEALTDPITQIVRNSAVHGLETKIERIASSKPVNGLITLSAYMRDGSAVLEITDDGEGINTEALGKRALELGIVTEETLSSMPENKKLDFIFEPGMSTASTITSLSGRGLGMDIVKTNVEKLGGTVEIESEKGRGTTVRLKSPPSMSVIKALIVTIDSICYAIADLNIDRIVRISKENPSKRIERINKSLVLILDGKIIPIVSMKEIEAKGLEPSPADKILEQSSRDGIVKCIVLRADGKKFALLIDNILDTEQILIKPLPVYLQNCPCYSNVTVLGNGNAVAVLDASGIMRYMGLAKIEKEAQIIFGSLEADTSEADNNKKQVIIFTCSGPEHYAVTMDEVSRLEVINSADIQEIGSEQFVNIADKTVQIVRPENFAPANKRNYAKKKLYVLVFKKSASPLGLLVNKVIDNVYAEFSIDSSNVLSDYIFGTSVFNEKVVIFLNPAAITAKTEEDKLNKKIIRETSTA